MCSTHLAAGLLCFSDSINTSKMKESVADVGALRSLWYTEILSGQVIGC